jgi:hypothetical protein
MLPYLAGHNQGLFVCSILRGMLMKLMCTDKSSIIERKGILGTLAVSTYKSIDSIKPVLRTVQVYTLIGQYCRCAE